MNEMPQKFAIPESFHTKKDLNTACFHLTRMKEEYITVKELGCIYEKGIYYIIEEVSKNRFLYETKGKNERGIYLHKKDLFHLQEKGFSQIK